MKCVFSMDFFILDVKTPFAIHGFNTNLASLWLNCLWLINRFCNNINTLQGWVSMDSDIRVVVVAVYFIYRPS